MKDNEIILIERQDEEEQDYGEQEEEAKAPLEDRQAAPKSKTSKKTKTSSRHSPNLKPYQTT